MQRDRGWKRAVRDAAPVALVLALCPLVAAMAPGPQGPLARAQRLIGLERSWGMFFEPGVHRWVAARPDVMRVAQFAYAAVHLPVMLGVLAWIWVARAGAFPLARRTFVLAQGLIVAGYVLAPTAPPRMVPSAGYDGPIGGGLTGLDRLAMSPYAAMPSGHAAFAVIAAGCIVALSRRPLVRLAALAYPVAVLLEIIATGNHIWLDAAAGAAAAAVAFGLARLIEHALPGADRGPHRRSGARSRDSATQAKHRPQRSPRQPFGPGGTAEAKPVNRQP